MAKKLSISDFLTKISYVFGLDCYVIENTYVIEGKGSSDKNSGYHLITLGDEFKEVLNETYPEKTILYIENVKKAKKEYDENVKIITLEPRKKLIYDQLHWLKNKIDKIAEWKPFSVTENQLNSIFVERTLTEIPLGNEYPSFYISKGVLPLVTEKNFSDVLHFVQKDNSITDSEVYDLFCRIDLEFFKIDMLFILIQLQ